MQKKVAKLTREETSTDRHVFDVKNEEVILIMLVKDYDCLKVSYSVVLLRPGDANRVTTARAGGRSRAELENIALDSCVALAFGLIGG